MRQRLIAGFLAFATIASGPCFTRDAVAQSAIEAQTLTTTTGYRVDFDIYPAPGPLLLVFMHGKNSSHRTPNMKTFADRVSASGTTVYLPSMPWSRAWNGTVADAQSTLDALVERAAAQGKKVLIGGQSLGATFSMGYRPAAPPASLVGKVFMSPGGLLDLIPAGSPFWRTVGPEVDRARAHEAAGQGGVPTGFGGANAVGEKLVSETYTMTPLIFLSFHDPGRFPSIKAALPATRLPVFWASGTRDPTLNAKRRSFDMMPRNPASVYVEPDGDHNSTLLVGVDPLIAWLQARAAP
jgi:pimeloyl-ACP methyl ester carboxylesterase